jgi:hypothetical protein
MYFFFHFITGLILGFLVSDFLRDRRWILPVVIGAVLPDIIDKPLNFILLPAMNGDGRFLFHNLIVFAVLLVAGYLLWKYYASPLLIALDLGIISHQVLDSMWLEPVQWLYPLLGPYPLSAAAPPDHIISLLESDLSNPAEWVLIGVVIVGLVLFWYREPLLVHAVRYRDAVLITLKAGEILLWALCGFVAACAVLRIPLRDLAVSTPDQYALAIGVIALGAVLFMTWREDFAGTLEGPYGRSVPPLSARGILRDRKARILVAVVLIIIILAGIMAYSASAVSSPRGYGHRTGSPAMNISYHPTTQPAGIAKMVPGPVKQVLGEMTTTNAPSYRTLLS